MKNNFDVDEYFLNAKYSEVMKNSPDPFSDRHPTIYSPDRKWIYFSSQDEIFDTKDIDGLKQLLQRLSRVYKTYLATPTIPFIKLHKIRVDCFAVCELIAGQVENPEDYHDPDSYLAPE